MLLLFMIQYLSPHCMFTKVLEPKRSSKEHGKAEISESDFIGLFEDKLGPLNVVKAFFRLCDSKKTGYVDYPAFLQFLTILHGNGTIEVGYPTQTGTNMIGTSFFDFQGI